MCVKIDKMFILAALVLVLSVLYPYQSNAGAIGNVGATEGTTSLRRAGEPEFRKISENELLQLSDMLQADSNSRLFLKFSDSSYASLGENSELYVFDFASEDAAKYFGADVTSGSVRFVKKLQHTNPPSSYTITTPTAMINLDPSDRTADFVVTVHSPQRTTVTVIRGQVRVRNIAENLTLERLVDSCRKVNVEEGKEPFRVTSVSTARLKGLIELTTIPDTLPQDVPECGGRYVIKPECARCTIWDGTQCLPCEDLGLVCIKGRCVDLDCGPCRIQWGDRCVPCRELGLVCDKGQCIQKFCPPCRVWDGRRCVRCEDFGRICIDGRCVRPLECPPCSFWNGRRCVGCMELGMLCIGGHCVFRPCGPCEVRRGADCVACAELGMRCEGGRCVRVFPVEKQDRPHPPERPIDVKPAPAPGLPPVLPPAQGIAPLPGVGITPPRPDSPALTPEKPRRPDKPDKPGRPERPGGGKLPLEPPDKPDVSVKPPENQIHPGVIDKPQKPDRPVAPRPGVTQGTPKPLETEPGPRPRPMPEAPKLDQRRDNRPDRQKPPAPPDQFKPESKPALKHELKMERPSNEPPQRMKRDLREEDKKER